MQCRKCGAKNITRRRAGVFACRRCGVQPGTQAMDRFGTAMGRVEPAAAPAFSDYQIIPRQPRLRGNATPDAIADALMAGTIPHCKVEM